jgi:hypothetical protein
MAHGEGLSSSPLLGNRMYREVRGRFFDDPSHGSAKQVD